MPSLKLPWGSVTSVNCRKKLVAVGSRHVRLSLSYINMATCRDFSVVNHLNWKRMSCTMRSDRVNLLSYRCLATGKVDTTVINPNNLSASSPSSILYQDLVEKVQKARPMLDLISKKMNIDDKRKRLNELQKNLEDESLYYNTATTTAARHSNSEEEGGTEKAIRLMKEASHLNAKVEKIDKYEKELRDLEEMGLLAFEEGDDVVLKECCDRMEELQEEVHGMELEMLLGSAPTDEGDCYVEIFAGAGGRESADWVEMLREMYERFARLEDKAFDVQTMQETWGEGGGLRNVLLKLSGPCAYGWCKSEAGVHRLVRISPFDSNARRHTSFAQVRVYPAQILSTTGAKDIQIDNKELRIDTYRSQGAGGQHVNTTDSAVRITHLPTGLVATCQAERSQHRNKAMAMEVIKSKLFALQEEESKEKKAQYRSGLGDNSWGNQIRSYVLHPYQLVKDHRTGVEVNDVSRVLQAGELDVFIKAYLAQCDQQNKQEEGN